MMKKAQAAMEFLMTYGWAILVVLVAIGALAYFGVLSPDRFLPERCTGPAGMDCLDKASMSTGTPGAVLFAVKNNQGFAVNLTEGISVGTSNDDCGLAASGDLLQVVVDGVETLVDDGSGSAEVVLELLNNQNAIFNVSCTTITTGRFKTDITIPYLNTETGIAHSATFSITGRAP